MMLSNSKPPIYDECAKAFKLSGREIFTYGNTIYNPSNLEIQDHVFIHEEVHGEQQKHDDHVAKIWWKRYLADPKFRIEQEIEAYRAQYKFICSKVKDRNARYRFLHHLATDMSGPMYGYILSYVDAMGRIRQ